MEKASHLAGNLPPATQQRPRSGGSWGTRFCLAAAVVFGLHSFRCLQSHTSIVERNQLTDFSVLSTHCARVSPIAASQFQQRQVKLAQTLYELGAVAYIAEPGPNAQYYANISLSDWYLSERPFLVMITPEVAHASMSSDKPKVEAKVTIITPRFEATRASLLHIPTPETQSDVIFAEWAEDENPYDVVTDIITTLHSTTYKPTQVLVDEGTRFFVVDGIVTAVSKHRYQVHNTPSEIAAIRERKTKEEIEILRCANEVTLQALRLVKSKMYIGIRESEAQVMIRTAIAAAGLEDGSSIVLFGESASLPHGSGTDRILTRNDLILFDIGGSLHGYYSDLTRTFALPDSHIPTQALEKWFLVQTAQQVAARTAKEGALASDVDAAARNVIERKGLGKWFTHRLGHGIGLQVHEAPYLRGGNNVKLSIGNTFSNEPGIYIPGEIGIRLEDCIVIDEDGNSLLLTAGVGGTARSPWEP